MGKSTDKSASKTDNTMFLKNTSWYKNKTTKTDKLHVEDAMRQTYLMGGKVRILFNKVGTTVKILKRHILLSRNNINLGL